MSRAHQNIYIHDAITHPMLSLPHRFGTCFAIVVNVLIYKDIFYRFGLIPI
ncbi:hypothetical protein CCP3SC1_880008 [Gammaproteobacteria bacterium]